MWRELQADGCIKLHWAVWVGSCELKNLKNHPSEKFKLTNANRDQYTHLHPITYSTIASPRVCWHNKMDLKIPVQLRNHLWKYWLKLEIPQRHRWLTLCVFMEMLQRVKSPLTTQHRFTFGTEIKKHFDWIFSPSGVKMTTQRSGRPFREKKAVWTVCQMDQEDYLRLGDGSPYNTKRGLVCDASRGGRRRRCRRDPGPPESTALVCGAAVGSTPAVQAWGKTWWWLNHLSTKNVKIVSKWKKPQLQ